MEKTETELKAFEVGTSLTKPWPLPATLQSISGCLSHRGKTKNQTDQSNASYTKSSPSTMNLIGQTYQSIVFPRWDKQPEIKRMLHKGLDAVKLEAGSGSGGAMPDPLPDCGTVVHLTALCTYLGAHVLCFTCAHILLSLT